MAANELLAAARNYAGHGRPVFPLVPGKKAPLTPRGFHDATLESRQINEWWHETPNAGIGLVTGSGLVVLDVDVQHGGEINPYWPQPTLMVNTKNGGWHLYYTVDRAVPCSVGRLGEGIDIRGEGGYVVAPPTPGWTWANPGTPILDIDALLLVPLHRGGPADPDWVPFEQAEEVIAEGGRNDYLARFTGWLVRNGLDGADLREAVDLENERIISPPLDESEVGTIVRSISRYR